MTTRASSATSATTSLEHRDVAHPDQLALAAGVFALLADPTRLHLLWTLTQGPRDVGTLVDIVGASKTSVSQHLAKLRLAGLVESTRIGRHVEYRLPGGHLERLVREALNHADHQVTGEPHHG